MGLPTSVDGKIEAADELRAQGNAAFGSGDAKAAIRCYTKIFAFVNGLDSGPELANYSDALDRTKLTSEQKEQILALRIAANNNLAAAYLRLEKHEKALKHADAALALEPANRKAMYRRAMALEHLDSDKALLQLQALLEAEPKNVAARQAYTRIKASVALKRKEEEKAYSFAGMFNRGDREKDNTEKKL